MKPKRPLPKIYASRPDCCWLVYPCHRAVDAGATLCALHKVSARATNRAKWDLNYDDSAVGADPGCDCSACLEKLP